MFGSIAGSDDHETLKKKKNQKFNFLNKLKINKNKADQGTSEDDESKTKARLSTELDAKASDPIHVNNLFKQAQMDLVEEEKTEMINSSYEAQKKIQDSVFELEPQKQIKEDQDSNQLQVPSEKHEEDEVFEDLAGADNPYIQYRSKSMAIEEKGDADLESFIDYEKYNKKMKKIRKNKENELLAYQSMYQKSYFVDEEERDENTVFNETCKEQEARIRKESPFGSLLTWKLLRIIVKSNDDVRQEQFAMQLISQFEQIFKSKKLDMWMRPYEIIGTGQRAGIIEVAQDALSIDSIKKKMGKNSKIMDYFKQQFGSTKKQRFKHARDNFCKSLAAYSLLCYILQIKDRHNGNILIDIEGHIMHIDFGFFLSNAPGKGLQFEKAPFKLTSEQVEVLGGARSQTFAEFRELLKQGFLALQENAEKIIIIVEMMFLGQNDLPCFKGGEQSIIDLKQRFFPTGKRFNNKQCMEFIDSLIEQSYDNWRTRCYDQFQYCVQGIV